MGWTLLDTKVHMRWTCIGHRRNHPTSNLCSRQILNGPLKIIDFQKEEADKIYYVKKWR